MADVSVSQIGARTRPIKLPARSRSPFGASSFVRAAEKPTAFLELEAAISKSS